MASAASNGNVRHPERTYSNHLLEIVPLDAGHILAISLLPLFERPQPCNVAYFLDNPVFAQNLTVQKQSLIPAEHPSRLSFGWLE